MNQALPPEIVIEAPRKWVRLNLGELWEYRDLFWQLVRRDFSTKYRQTLVGPAWFILQPLMMTGVFTIVFGRVARLPTDNAPPVLFYLCGMLSWTFFAQTMPAIAATFTANAHLFGKIYFPRLTVPLAQMVGNLFAQILYLITFAATWTYYRYFTDFSAQAMTPLLLAIGLVLQAQLQVMVLALGVGTLLAAATGKYRDLQHVLPFMIQVWFYATSIVYPLSMISTEAKWRWVVTLNPMTAAAEAMKLALLGASSWTPGLALGAWCISFFSLAAGLTAFTRAERTVVDVA